MQNLTLRIIVAFTFAIGAVVFCVMAIKRYERFFFTDYQGNAKARFKDNLVGNTLLGLGVGCLVSAFFVYQEGELSWGLLQLVLLFGGLAIMIGIAGLYWRSYEANRLWAGLLPIVREQYGYAQSEAAKQPQIDPAKLKLSRRSILTGLSLALLVFFGVFFLISMSSQSGSLMSSLHLKLLVSSGLALSAFATFTSKALARRVQKLRDGEVLDDD